jgi:hypothetical protein
MFQTLVTVAFLLTNRYASRAFVQLPYDFWLNLFTVSFARSCCSLKASECMLLHRERRPLKRNNSDLDFRSDVPLNVSVQWYIGHLECTVFGNPRNMPNVPVIPQFGNALQCSGNVPHNFVPEHVPVPEHASPTHL